MTAPPEPASCICRTYAMRPAPAGRTRITLALTSVGSRSASDAGLCPALPRLGASRPRPRGAMQIRERSLRGLAPCPMPREPSFGQFAGRRRCRFRLGHGAAPSAGRVRLMACRQAQPVALAEARSGCFATSRSRLHSCSRWPPGLRAPRWGSATPRGPRATRRARPAAGRCARRDENSRRARARTHPGRTRGFLIPRPRPNRPFTISWRWLDAGR